MYIIILNGEEYDRVDTLEEAITYCRWGENLSFKYVSNDAHIMIK